jgi:hypothetical protein
MSTPTANSFLDRFDRLDRALIRAGFPATSPWWRAELGRFAESGRGRWVVRAGRRAGKSSTMCRVAVAKALADDWTVPPGDRAVVAFVSVDRREAAARLHTIAEILRAVGVPFEERADEIELTERAVVFRVITSSLKGVVGFTAILLLADEMARWDVEGANPAAEIMRSLRPTTATVPSAFELCVSSPWGISDHHYDLVEAGDGPGQIVSIGATWECNPTITEAWTREKEPDALAWSREYAGVPGGIESGAFNPADVIRAFDSFGEAQPTGERFIVLDPSSMVGKDTFAFGVVSGTTTGGMVLIECDGMQRATYPEVVDRIVELARDHGATRVFSDQAQDKGLETLLAQRGLNVTAIKWTMQSKHVAGVTLRRMFSEGLIALPAHTRLRGEVTGLRAVLRPTADETVHYPTNGKDFLSLLFCLAHAIDGEHVSLAALGTDDYIAGIKRLSDASTGAQAAGGIMALGASSGPHEEGVAGMRALAATPGLSVYDTGVLRSLAHAVEFGTTEHYVGAGSWNP